MMLAFRTAASCTIFFLFAGCAHVVAPPATGGAPLTTSPQPSVSPLYISYFEFLPKKDAAEFGGYFIITDKADTPFTPPLTMEFTLDEAQGQELARLQVTVAAKDYTPYRSRISGEEIGPAFIWSVPYGDVKRTKHTHALAHLRITLADGTALKEQRLIKLPKEIVEF